MLACLTRALLHRGAGNILNGLSAQKDVMAIITRQCVFYCYLALGAGFAGFLQAWGFSLLSERLSNRTRRAYLEALLATEVAFYDTASSGELVNRLSENIVLLNLALGPKMGVLLQAVSTFFAGLIVGLYQGWRLALVLLGFAPLLAGVGAATSRWVAASTSRESVAYSAAGSVTQEVFTAIRTVAAFTSEPAAQRRYAAALESSLRTGIVQKVVSGIGSGTMQLLMFTTYAVVLWFGTFLIRKDIMNGGKVMTVFFRCACCRARVLFQLAHAHLSQRHDGRLVAGPGGAEHGRHRARPRRRQADLRYD